MGKSWVRGVCPAKGMPEEEKGCLSSHQSQSDFRLSYSASALEQSICDSINAVCFISWAIQANHHYLTHNCMPNFV